MKIKMFCFHIVLTAFISVALINVLFCFLAEAALLEDYYYTELYHRDPRSGLKVRINLWSYWFYKLPPQIFEGFLPWLKVYLRLKISMYNNFERTWQILLKYAKKSNQIVLYLEIFNFKTFRAEILKIFEFGNLENRCLHKFILTLSDL